HRVNESTFTILCTMRGSHDGNWLQHCNRHGQVEPTRISFRTPLDHGEPWGHSKPISTAEDIKPLRCAYPVVAKGTAVQLAGFKSSVRMKNIARVFTATMLMIQAGS